MGGSRRPQGTQQSVTAADLKGASRKRKTTEGQSPNESGAKRRRVTRACDQCRQGREKCDGALPCHSCQEGNRQCSYRGASKRRGVQPGYIRALEAMLAWILTNMPGAQTQLLDLLAREPVTEELGVLSKDGSISEHMSHVWMQSQVHRDLEVMLDGKHGNARDAHSYAVDPPNLRDTSEPPDSTLSAPQAIDVDMMHTSPLMNSKALSQPHTIPKVLSQTYFDEASFESSDRMAIPQFDHAIVAPTDITESSPMPNLDFFNSQDPSFFDSSVALDPFLDELASGDTPDGMFQPQFMQNLGLGSDLDPNQFINDSGEWIFPP